MSVNLIKKINDIFKKRNKKAHDGRSMWYTDLTKDICADYKRADELQ